MSIVVRAAGERFERSARSRGVRAGRLVGRLEEIEQMAERALLPGQPVDDRFERRSESRRSMPSPSYGLAVLRLATEYSRSISDDDEAGT